jgi:hypothetical protein
VADRISEEHTSLPLLQVAYRGAELDPELAARALRAEGHARLRE